jgi:hypothetical protein
MLANGTPQARKTRLEIRFLQPGIYSVELDGQLLNGHWTASRLADGLVVSLPANSMKRVRVQPVRLELPAPPDNRPFDASTTWLSDRTPVTAQRGTGAPQPTFCGDRSFDGLPIRLGGTQFAKGLGCAANTVLVYDLRRQFARFQATVGVDDEVRGSTNPPPSVFFTVLVDGRLGFESGPMLADTPSRDVDLDVRQARTLMLRMSCNWDDDGRSQNDRGNWAAARLTGQPTGPPVIRSR